MARARLGSAIGESERLCGGCWHRAGGSLWTSGRADSPASDAALSRGCCLTWGNHAAVPSAAPRPMVWQGVPVSIRCWGTPCPAVDGGDLGEKEPVLL